MYGCILHLLDSGTERLAYQGATMYDSTAVREALQSASGRRKIQQPVAERAEGKQVEFPDFH